MTAQIEGRKQLHVSEKQTKARVGKGNGKQGDKTWGLPSSAGTGA